ncbi:MAG TPA: ROK family protein [Candidatus Acidoferrales bacterium]|nr:ROK family protein [Candidatus Acidoferrales bacterium]
MKTSVSKRKLRVLAIDVGGTHVKILATGEHEERKLNSGLAMTPQKMTRDVKRLAEDWKYDVVSIGYPGPIVHGQVLRDPYNLGHGWVGFHFRKAFGHPVKLMNDAAMQALGSYRGGRMLFLGLGTGLGSAMIVDGIVEPMEIAHLPYKKDRTYEDYIGLRGLQRHGKKKWRRYVADIVERLKLAMEPDYVIIGGGNAKKLKELPPGAELGDNRNAFRGAFRMWETAGWQGAPSSGKHGT